jgi:hypothetical protein
MPKVEQVVAVAVDPDSPKRCVATACTEVEEAVKDRRENGGTRSVVRAKALSLIELLVADLEA